MIVSGWRRLWPAGAAVLIACIVTPRYAWSAPATPGRTLAIQADELRIDAATRVATAIGRVRISDGVLTATAARAILRQREGRGLLSGDARVSGPDGVLSGQELAITFTTRTITRVVAQREASLETTTSLISAATITLVPSSETLIAEGRVTVFTRPDVVATAARMTFERARGTIVLDGQARVQNAEGFVEGRRLDADRKFDRVTITGSVHAVYREIDIRSRSAEVFGIEKRAVFAGDVRLEQPGRRMTTDRVTVWYAAGRVVAEGATWMRLDSQP